MLRALVLFFFRPDLYEAEFFPLEGDALLVNRVAAHFDCTEAQVVEFAAKHANVNYTMDDFFVDPRLPWQVRHFIRENSSLP